MTNTILENIFWYPIKGFPGTELKSTKLLERAGIPNDRRFAITRGTTSDGNWMPARSYFINAWVDGLLNFSIEKANNSGLKITNPAGAEIYISFDDSATLAAANEKLAAFMAHVPVDLEKTAPKLIEQNDHGGNWDFPDTPISIINAGSVRAVSDAVGKDMAALRFRGNLVLSGMPAWEELGLMGKRIRIGEAELEVMRPTVRCPAPGVNTQTGERDIAFEKAMPKLFGHSCCGMYAFTVKPGAISAGDTVEVIADAEISLVDASAEADDYRLWPRKVKITTCEIGEDTTRMSLAQTGPWPLPQGSPGQRLRLHLGPEQWTTEYIAATSPGHYHLEVEKSSTADPVTEKLRSEYKAGDELVVSGPYGRA